MKNIEIQLLTPVHIGSGRQWQGNAEYFYFQEEKKIAVVDETKVLQLIGSENIHQWLDAIENPNASFLAYLKKRKQGLASADLAEKHRILPLKGRITPQPQNAMREQIRSGNGAAYIPGSSLKGAIRTALFAQALIERGRMLDYREIQNDRTKKIEHSTLQKNIFGADPNADWLRLLQVGDFYFEEQATHAAFCESLNEYGGKSPSYNMKNEVRQLIEYLPAGATAQGWLRVPENLQKAIDQRLPFAPKWQGKLSGHNLNLTKLFALLNAHTRRLVSDEIKGYEDVNLPEEADEFVPELENILNALDGCDANSCIIRLGWGTGYRTMTGDWVCREELVDDDLYDDIKSAARRTPKYNDFPLPKTRRMMLGGVPLGFVKLTKK